MECMQKRMIGIEDLKNIQMDVLQVLHEFCTKNNIRYSLACGTMLGAVRHKGYIPWDDDIDIYMLREDYIKLVETFPKEYKNIKFATLEREPLWDKANGQAYDTRTEMHEGEERDLKHRLYVGVGIDVYPIDEVPLDEKQWLAYNKKRLKLQWMLIYKYSVLRPGRKLLLNLGLMVAKVLLCPFSQRQIAIWISKYAQKYNGCKSGRVFETVQGILQKRPFDKACFDELVDMPFENRAFWGFKNHDAYLSNGYGDYMQLPPKEKQVNHHYYRAWWK